LGVVPRFAQLPRALGHEPFLAPLPPVAAPRYDRMTDRFYPVGLAADVEAWKTTYEVQNEMRSFARSAFPPGTAVHLPGARDSFGFSSPGPLRMRLAQPDAHPEEKIDIGNPRECHAIPRTQAPDDRATFHVHDTDEMARSYRSPVASVTFGGSRSLPKTRSLPSLSKTPAPPRMSMAPPLTTKMEDDHFSYFIPKGLHREGEDRINPHHMSKLRKADRISFPFTGEGTGFRTQSGMTDWAPPGSYEGVPTSYRTTFAKPPFYRLSPLTNQ